MPEYTRTASYQLSRNLVIVDTNVLVAAFLPADQNHDVAQLLFDRDFAEQILVPTSVIVETWGMLTRRDRDAQVKRNFLVWLTNPGSGATPILDDGEFNVTADALRKEDIDCVHVLLLRLATHLTTSISAKPPVRIATFDTRDFLRFVGRTEFSFMLFDMNAYEEMEFE